MASLDTPNALLNDRLAGQPDAESPAVALANVTRVFGAAPAVVRVELRVERGELLVVRGPNGAGKSTLLRILATAISPTYGTGSVLGFDLAEERDEIRRRTEYLGHRTRLYEDLTGRENLRFAGTLFGLDLGGVDGALARVGLGQAADERVRTYSQGMRQRVALARAFLRSPQLLLLDEPYAGLDGEAKDLVDELVLNAHVRGRTVILATHDTTRATAARTVYMEGGQLLLEAP